MLFLGFYAVAGATSLALYFSVFHRNNENNAKYLEFVHERELFI